MPYYRWTLTAKRPKPHYPKQLKSLGDHLKARRLDLGVTQWAIASQLGVSTATIRNWEAGHTSIEVRFYPALLSFLGFNQKASYADATSDGSLRAEIAEELGADVNARLARLDSGEFTEPEELIAPLDRASTPPEPGEPASG